MSSISDQMRTLTLHMEADSLSKLKTTTSILSKVKIPEPAVSVRQVNKTLQSMVRSSREERLTAGQLRRTLEATMAHFPSQRTEENIACLKKLNTLAPLVGVHIVDLESEFRRTSPLLPVVIANLVADYFIDHAVVQGIISTGYQQVIFAESKACPPILENKFVEIEKVQHGYDLSSRIVCNANRPLELESLCTWDFLQMAEYPINLREMNLGRYAENTRSLVNLIFLLEQADQIQLQQKKPGLLPNDPDDNLVASTLRRSITPLNLNLWSRSGGHGLERDVCSTSLLKHAQHIQRLALHEDLGGFLKHIPRPEDLSIILARSFAPINDISLQRFLKLELLPINLKILIDNLNDDSCFNLSYDSTFAKKLFEYMRQQPSPAVRERLLTLVANSVVYGNEIFSISGLTSSLRKFKFSLEELLPAMVKTLKQIATSLEKTYVRYGYSFFNALSSLSEYQYSDPKNKGPSQTVPSYVAGYLSEHAFLPLDVPRYQNTCLQMLNAMALDRRDIVIANSILRERKKTCEFLTKHALPIPSEKQMVACLDAYLRRNISTLFDKANYAARGEVEATFNFFNIVETNLSHFTKEHQELILRHFPADFTFEFHSMCPILTRHGFSFHNDACPPPPY